MSLRANLSGFFGLLRCLHAELAELVPDHGREHAAHHAHQYLGQLLHSQRYSGASHPNCYTYLTPSKDQSSPWNQKRGGDPPLILDVLSDSVAHHSAEAHLAITHVLSLQLAYDSSDFRPVPEPAPPLDDRSHVQPPYFRTSSILLYNSRSLPMMTSGPYSGAGLASRLGFTRQLKAQASGQGGDGQKGHG